MQLISSASKKLVKPTSVPTLPHNTASHKPTKAEKRAARKARKAAKSSKSQLNLMQSDAPAGTHQSASLLHKRNRKMRVKCTTDADCSGGQHCFTNKKGHKHCKGKNHNKPIGKKCHSSDQCMKGNATT
ncbi:hypothetical protein EB796_016140 [Bugula neritina]|uniref:Uncharacterized protein n=1 Tax=Bugula neritina TaxID=10212 RepID=A0A7J7JGU1_BUGNE|nr:hypothetical protein EB796_016140 [Bugula neritina]